VDFFIALLRRLKLIRQQQPLLVPHIYDLLGGIAKKTFAPADMDALVLKKQLTILQQISLDEKDVHVVKVAFNGMFYVMKLLMAIKTDIYSGDSGALDISSLQKFITQVIEHVKSAQAVSHFWSGLDKCSPTLLLEGDLFEEILASSPHQARVVFSHLSSSPERLRDLCDRVAASFEKAKRHKLEFIIFVRSCFDKLRASIGVSEAQTVFRASTIAPILANYMGDKVPVKLQKSACQLQSLLLHSQEQSSKVKPRKGKHSAMGPSNDTTNHPKEKRQKRDPVYKRKESKPDGMD